jgi:hypothetical protein
LFAALVGASAKGRKGQSWSTPRHIFSEIDGPWAGNCVKSGLSSGEGLIYHVRDRRLAHPSATEAGAGGHEADKVIDPGVADNTISL